MAVSDDALHQNEGSRAARPEPLPFLLFMCPVATTSATHQAHKFSSLLPHIDLTTASSKEPVNQFYVAVYKEKGREMTVRTHCPGPAIRGGGGGSGQASSWRPERAAYRCFVRPDGVHRAPPHEDAHHWRHHPPYGADGHRPQAYCQARITRMSRAGHRERPPCTVMGMVPLPPACVNRRCSRGVRHEIVD